MNKLLASMSLAIASLAASSAMAAAPASGPLTIAAFGDWPYNQNLLTNAKLLTNSVNSDASVGVVLHVGDIHSGSMACTSAGTLPPISTSNPGWNQQIYYQFQQFERPLVYTPGDNEWTDCHKSKQLSSGYPLKELAAVRQLFFAKPGVTLGKAEKKVMSQTQYFDAAYPSDAQFVENVMWMQHGALFATFNMPGGSNNDTVPWTGIFADPTAQQQEVADRSAANIRWLKAAFATAQAQGAKVVIIALQADMWDPEGLPANGGPGLDQYTSFVQELANQSVAYANPVLLLNGDSHVFKVDQPLADPASATGVIHNTVPVPNLTRMIVQGSTNAPAEWLRIVVQPSKNPAFSYSNVPYCTDPTASCQ